MKIACNDGTLRVSGITELGAANASAFQSQVKAALNSHLKEIEIDLSQTGFADCGGVGALVALNKCARDRNSKLRISIVNPAPPVRCLFKLTHMDSVFPIERR